MNKHKIIYKINYSKFDKNYMYLKGGASLEDDEQGVAMSYRLLNAQPLETGIHLNQDKTLQVVDASGNQNTISRDHHNYNSFLVMYYLFKSQSQKNYKVRYNLEFKWKIQHKDKAQRGVFLYIVPRNSVLERKRFGYLHLTAWIDVGAFKSGRLMSDSAGAGSFHLTLGKKGHIRLGVKKEDGKLKIFEDIKLAASKKKKKEGKRKKKMDEIAAIKNEKVGGVMVRTILKQIHTILDFTQESQAVEAQPAPAQPAPAQESASVPKPKGGPGTLRDR